MGVILQRSNQALDINPPTGDTHALSVAGSDWLWAVTAFYAVILLIVVGHAYVARNGERIFHYLFTISLFTGFIAYFAMASDLASTPIVVADSLYSPGTREIFYAKYVNWFVGWTPLVVGISLISGVSWATIIYNVSLVWFYVLNLLFSSLVATNYKWGFFAFNIFAYVLLAASLFHYGSLGARRLGIAPHYSGITGWFVFLLLLYPIAYGISDGGNKITVTNGFVFFGILDVLNVPVFAILFILLSNRWDYGALNLHFTQYGRVAQGGVLPEHEKVVNPAPAAVDPAPAAVAPETV